MNNVTENTSIEAAGKFNIDIIIVERGSAGVVLVSKLRKDLSRCRLLIEASKAYQMNNRTGQRLHISLICLSDTAPERGYLAIRRETLIDQIEVENGAIFAGGERISNDGIVLSVANTGGNDDPDAVTNCRERVRGTANFCSDEASIFSDVPSIPTNSTDVMAVEYESQRIRGGGWLWIRRALLARLKKTLLVWIAVYPAVLIVIALVGDLLQEWPLPLRLLVATLIIVPVVVNMTEPAVKGAVAAIQRR